MALYFSNNLEFGLLTYLWTFTDQHDKQEIDLGFLKSLIDSGVNINAVDQHGKRVYIFLKEIL